MAKACVAAMDPTNFNALALIIEHDKDNTSDEESVGEDDDGLQVELNARLSDAVDEIDNLHKELAVQRQADQTRQKNWDAYETQYERRMVHYKEENTTLRTEVTGLTDRIGFANDRCKKLTAELDQQNTKARSLERALKLATTLSATQVHQRDEEIKKVERKLAEQNVNVHNLQRDAKITAAREQAEDAIMAYRISCLGDDLPKQRQTGKFAQKCIDALRAFAVH